MIRKTAVAAAVAAASLAALAVSGTGTAAKRESLVLKEVTTQFYFADAAPAFPPRGAARGAGNLLYFTGALYDSKNRSRGTNFGFCLTVHDANSEVTGSEGPGAGVPTPTPGRPAKSIAQCQQTLRLKDGTITLEGIFNQLAFEGDCASKPTARFCSGSTETLAITGGTGRYSAASGVVTLKQTEYPDVIRLTVKLSR